MNYQERIDTQYDGLQHGDARRCPRHPEVKTSSPDGQFGAPCGRCEMEMDEESDE